MVNFPLFRHTLDSLAVFPAAPLGAEHFAPGSRQEELPRAAWAATPREILIPDDA